LTAHASATGLDFHELRDRTVDLVLTANYGNPVEDDIEIEILFDEPNFVVAGLSNPLASRRKIDLTDLVNEAWIFPQNHVIVEMITKAFEARGLEPPIERVSAGSISLRNYLLATGRFLTVFPNSILHYNAKRWSLKALPIDLRIKPPSISILTLKHRTLSPVVNLFIEHLREAAKPMKTLSEQST